MITAETAATMIASVVSLGAIWCFYWWPYMEYRTDWLRQQLFRLRDELFDEAAAGLLPFDSHAYGLLRTTLNGFIRFAPRISFTRVTMLMLFARDLGSEGEALGFHARWARATHGLPEETRGRLQAYVTRAHRLILQHMLLRSPLLALSIVTIVIPVLLWLLWKACIARILSVMQQQFEKIDCVAVALGA